MYLYLQALKGKLIAEPPLPAEELLLALRLLQELCSVTKGLQLYHRAAFYRKVWAASATPPRRSQAATSQPLIARDCS